MAIEEISVRDTALGTNVPVATDRISSQDYQLIKLVEGDDGVQGGMIHAANGLPITMEAPAATTGTITANAQTIQRTVTGHGTAIVTVNGTYSGITLQFEVSNDGGTNWYPVLGIRTDNITSSPASNTGSLSNLTQAFYVGCQGFDLFRVRSSSYSSGTQNVRITSIPIVIPGLVTEVAGTVSVSGSVTISGTPTVSITDGERVVSEIDASHTGYDSYSVRSASSNNAAAIKASAGRVFGWYIFNTNASVRYVKLYNKASSPSPSTDSSLLIARLGIPGGGGANVLSNVGIIFSSGIAIAMVTGSSDTDNTSVSAGDLLVNIFYK